MIYQAICIKTFFVVMISCVVAFTIGTLRDAIKTFSWSDLLDWDILPVYLWGFMAIAIQVTMLIVILSLPNGG